MSHDFNPLTSVNCADVREMLDDLDDKLNQIQFNVKYSTHFTPAERLECSRLTEHLTSKYGRMAKRFSRYMELQHNE